MQNKLGDSSGFSPGSRRSMLFLFQSFLSLESLPQGVKSAGSSPLPDDSPPESEIDRLQAFQNMFTKRILGYKMSSSEALNYLKWIPLAGRLFGHRCFVVQNALKGDIPEHFETFRSTLRGSHVYYTRNSYLPRLPNPRTDWGKKKESIIDVYGKTRWPSG